MTIPNSISAPVLKVSRRKKRVSDIKEIVTKINDIEDRMDCLQRHVALCCGSVTSLSEASCVIQDLVLRVLKECPGWASHGSHGLKGEEAFDRLRL